MSVNCTKPWLGAENCKDMKLEEEEEKTWITEQKLLLYSFDCYFVHEMLPLCVLPLEYYYHIKLLFFFFFLSFLTVMITFAFEAKLSVMLSVFTLLQD